MSQHTFIAPFTTLNLITGEENQVEKVIILTIEMDGWKDDNNFYSRL